MALKADPASAARRGVGAARGTARPRFEPIALGAAAPPGAVTCDGLVAGAELHLSHWRGNRTPSELKADTSTGIALEHARHARLGADRVVINNHFDTDGVLAVWTLLEPERALEHAELLVAAAEVGDFEEWPSDERGLWLQAAVTALGADARNDRDAYARVLPQLAALVENIKAHEDLWGPALDELHAAESSARAGALSVTAIGPIAVLTHAPGVQELPGPALFRLAPRGATRWLLAFARENGRYDYRYELPRWAWADTIDRPALRPPSRHQLVAALGPGWALKGGLGMTGLIKTSAPASLTPEALAALLAAHDTTLPRKGQRSAHSSA